MQEPNTESVRAASVRAALTAVADRMPPPRFPERAWQRGRRRRLARTAGTTVAVVVVLLLAIPVWWSTGPHGAEPATPAPASSTGVVPSKVRLPWLWQATIADSAPGPAAVVFNTAEGRYRSGSTVVVGTDGAYRIRKLPEGPIRRDVSPDGRRLIVGGTSILDLTTGRSVDVPGGEPLAWSRDGRTVASLLWDARGRQVNLVDVATGRITTVYTAGSAAPSYTVDQAKPPVEDIGFDAFAIAPDGATVVIPAGRDGENRLLAVDLAGTVRWDVATSRTGPIVYSPDGRHLATTAPMCPDRSTSCTVAEESHAVVLDAATGAEVRRLGRADTVLGFRGDDVVAVRGNPGRDTVIVQLGPDGERTLVTLDERASVPVIPLDLVERGTFGGPEARPNPFAAPVWVYALIGGFVLLFVAVRKGVGWLIVRTRP
ncbi:WD40 repeat domain-containing protein [Dactylosporangium sp. CS-033363]|uniref:WD40 repeat domain-containing protein n=1 Tax=Dactylosporangium sp. CS-033363 TaxID=3239935 RepID=UPI003D8FA74F